MKWGVIGLGYMAKRFAVSISSLNNTQLTAIASRSILKLKKFGDRYNIEKKHRFRNYEDILKCDEIQNIYISTVNNTHYELILKAIKANKNVLCEKPITINYEDVLEVFKELKRKKVFFMEAIPYRAHPLINLIIKTLKDKTIGEVINIKSYFGNNKKIKNKNHRLLSSQLGGGAIFDVGCYPVSFSNLIANLNNNGEKFIPKIINADGINLKTGVDIDSHVSLLYENNISSEIGVSIVKDMENKTTIQGSDGSLTIDNPWSPEEKSYIEITTNKRYYKLFAKSKLSLLSNQIDIVNKFINLKKIEGDYPCMTWQNSVDNAFVLNEWKKILTKKNEN
jgi:predicted dehydrogenase